MTTGGAARRVAKGVGAGVVAGVVGTAAMTVSSTVEARLRRRRASTAPARAAERVLGIERFADAAAESRFSTLVHWGYGTGWGVARGLLGAAGLGPAAAGPLHFAAMWGGAAAMLPALDVAPPVTRWGAEEVAIDVLHHLVYAGATNLAYERLARSWDGAM
jgi:hypothetical protein